MKRISFDYAILGQGIRKIYVNDTKTNERFPVAFHAPQTEMKLLVCSHFRGRTVQYPFIQVRRTSIVRLGDREMCADVEI